MPEQLGQRAPKLAPRTIPVPSRVQDSRNQQNVERAMNRRKKEMERCYTERAQVIETGKIRVETKRQVMRKDWTRRQEEEASDGTERCPAVGSLANRKFRARFQCLRLGSSVEATSDKTRQLRQLRGVSLGNNIDKR